MQARLYTYLATALVAAMLASIVTWRVQEWRWHANNAAEQADRDEVARREQQRRDREAGEQRATNDRKAGEHATELANINTQLFYANDKIAKLSDRRCLDAGTVGMLNAIGKPTGSGLGLRATTGHAASTAAAAAGSADDDNINNGHAPIGEPSADVYASEQDAARQIAVCRAEYGKVSDQLNKILDIEDRRDAQR